MAPTQSGGTDKLCFHPTAESGQQPPKQQSSFKMTIFVLDTGMHVKSLRHISILSCKIKVLSLTMSLSDMLEILAMSRLIAICTGSPAEGKKCFSREKGNVKGTVKALRMLCRWALSSASLRH